MIRRPSIDIRWPAYHVAPRIGVSFTVIVMAMNELKKGIRCESGTAPQR